MAPLPGSPELSLSASPQSIRLDASTVCQLKCPSCSTAQGNTARVLGAGYLALEAFQTLLERNPNITDVELSNYGEIFLNPHLVDLFRCAQEQSVTLHADNGANLNHATNEALEGLVKYRIRSLTCSIDGADNGTYQRYRVGGNFDRVISNIERISAYKFQYQSAFPLLTWQYVVFGHNEHQIEDARAKAQQLNMAFRTKLSWDDTFSPVINNELVQLTTGQPATRASYSKIHGTHYMRNVCAQLWRKPVINWDGRLLGCCINHWSDFGPNVFDEGLLDSLNSEKMQYARAMLTGASESRVDIPCSNCGVYEEMKHSGNWITSLDVSPLDQAITLSIHLPRGPGASQLRVYLLPGKIQPITYAILDAAKGIDVVSSEQVSVITTVPLWGEYTVCVTSVLNDQPIVEEQASYWIQISERPICQEIHISSEDS